MSYRQISPDLEEYARTKLNEDPKRRDDDIRAIKEWLRKEPHLNAREDDQWILSFLRGCKFSLEKTKKKLDSYYTMKTLLPEYYTNRDPMRPELQEIFNLGICLPLKTPDKKGRSVFLLRCANFDPKKHKVDDIMKCNYMNQDIALWENDRAVITGWVVIVDYKGLGLDCLPQVTPGFIKRSMTCSQEAYPNRPQAMHYINFPSVLESILALLKSFMKKKMVDRVKMYTSDLTEMYKDIPKESLPNEYGGTAGTVEELAAEWKKKVESYRDWLIADEKYKTVEKKRKGKPKTTSDVFGIEGSFRALTVD